MHFFPAAILQLCATATCALSLISCSEHSRDELKNSKLNFETENFVRLIDRYDVVVFAEIHGTNEAPEFLNEVSRTSDVSLSFFFELFPDSDNLSCDWNDNALPESWILNGRFGLNSRAYQKLICDIKNPQASQRHDALFYRGRDISNPTSDLAAAHFIRSRLNDRSDDKAIIVVGNAHVGGSSSSLDGALRSMGLNVLTLSVAAGGGQTWICAGEPGHLSCGPHRVRENSCPGQSMPSDNIFWRYDSRVDAACLYFPHVSPSPPAYQELR